MRVVSLITLAVVSLVVLGACTDTLSELTQFPDFNFDWNMHLDSGLMPTDPGIPDWCIGVQTDDPACWTPPEG